MDAYEARSILAINLGMAAFFAGHWSDAVDLYEQGRTNSEAMGNVTGAALASMNAVEILIDQGHLDRSRDALIEVRRVLGAAGYAAALSYAELLSGVVALRSGDLDRAAFRYSRSAAASSETGRCCCTRWSPSYASRKPGFSSAAPMMPLGTRRAGTIRELESSLPTGCRTSRSSAPARHDRTGRRRQPSDDRTSPNAAENAERTTSDYELAVTLRASCSDRSAGSSGAEPEANLIFDELGVIELGRVVGLVPTPASVSSPG